jgi:cytochrome c oxidase subunit 2
MLTDRTGNQGFDPAKFANWCRRADLLIVGPVMPFATHLLAHTDLGSPHGVTNQDHWTRQLWHITYIFAVPLGLLVLGAIVWCVIRYRVRPGHDRNPSQFQYHIPIEAAYTVIPLVIVAVVFGFMYSAENHVNKLDKNPAVSITVDGFQWGWRFIYPNGHEEVGTVANELDINSNANLPILYMPANESVQLHLVSLDVVHTFYVPAFLYNRDLIPGINNVVQFNVNKVGTFSGQCNNICGQYHAYMRFQVKVMSPADYQSWYAAQGACTVTTAGGGTDVPASCTAIQAQEATKP